MNAGQPDTVDTHPTPTTNAPRPTPAPAPAPRRIQLAVAAAAVVALGMGASTIRADFAGGVLYAVLIALLIALVLPRLRPVGVGGLAAVMCFAVELAQLSGAPAAAVDAVPALRYVLGTTFDAVDLVAYLVGATIGAVVVQVISRSSPGRRSQHDPGPRRQ